MAGDCGNSHDCLRNITSSFFVLHKISVYVLSFFGEWGSWSTKEEELVRKMTTNYHELGDKECDYSTSLRGRAVTTI